MTKILAGALVVMAAAIGCGKNDEVATSQVGYRNSNVIENASTKSIQTNTLSPASLGTAESGAPKEPVNDMQVEGATAPDLLVNVSKKTALRGETIELSAQGSPDVVEMMLSDGYGTTQSLVFDAASSTWKTAYRVPLNMKLERLGLSVKAKNGDERWRRVWVFLTLPENAVANAAPESSAVSDTVQQK
jgi:hypothetical protein